MQDQISSSPLVCLHKVERWLMILFTQTTQYKINEGTPNCRVTCLVLNTSVHFLHVSNTNNSQLRRQQQSLSNRLITGSYITTAHLACLSRYARILVSASSYITAAEA